MDPNIRRLRRQDVALGLADHEGQIGAPHEVQLLRLAPLGDTQGRAIALKLRESPLAQEVQIDRIEDDACLGAMGPGRVECGRRRIGTAQDHQVVIGAAAGQMVADPAHVRPVEHLHADALQVGDIGLGCLQVGGGEGHLEAEPLQDAEQIEHPHRAGLAIRCDHVVVDHQDPASHAALLRLLQILAALAEAGQDLGPARSEGLGVDPLIALQTRLGPFVATGADPLEVHDTGQRLVVDRAPGCTHPEGQIDILVIGGCEGAVEAAETPEERGLDGECGARAIVDGAPIAVLGLVRGVQVAVVPGRAVREEDGPGLLLPTVRIEEAAADDPGVGRVLEGVDQRIQPAGLDLGVVVQKDQIGTLRCLGPAIAGSDEPEILGVADQAQTGVARESFGGPVARAVVDDDRLEGPFGADPSQRGETVMCVAELVVDRDHHRDKRRSRAASGRPARRARRARADAAVSATRSGVVPRRRLSLRSRTATPSVRRTWRARGK